MTQHVRVSHPVAMPRTLGLLSALAVVFAASTSHAQPNPFEDYEQGRSAPAAEPADPAAPADQADLGVVEAEPASPRPATAEEPEPLRYRSEPYTWGLGGVLQLAYNGGTNESLAGESEAVNGLFLALAPRGSFFAAKNFEVSLAAGYLSTLAGSSGGSRGTSHSFFFEAGGHYHIPIADSGFALVPGAGIGGQFGSSSRRFIDVLGAHTSASASTMGLLVAGYLTVAYQLNSEIRVRSGISISGLIGQEDVKGAGRLSTSRAFVGLPVEVTYVF